MRAAGVFQDLENRLLGESRSRRKRNTAQTRALSGPSWGRTPAHRTSGRALPAVDEPRKRPPIEIRLSALQTHPSYPTLTDTSPRSDPQTPPHTHAERAAQLAELVHDRHRGAPGARHRLGRGGGGGGNSVGGPAGWRLEQPHRPQLDAISAQDGPQIAPRRSPDPPEIAPRSPPDRPTDGPQAGPRSTLDGPQRGVHWTPSRAKMGPKGIPKDPNPTADPPRWTQDRPRRDPNSPQDGPECTPDDPPSAPK